MRFVYIFIVVLMLPIKGVWSQTIVTDGAWKGVGSSGLSGGTAWLFQGYDDSAWPMVEAPNLANVIPVVPGSQSIWVLPYSDTAKMRKTFTVPVGDAYGGTISINADNEFELYFNGVSQGFYNNWMAGPFVFNISPALQGCVQNVIAINAANWGGPYGASLNTTLVVTNPLNTPVANGANNISCTSFTANWDSVPTADVYLLDVSTDPLFGSFYSVYHDYNVGNNLSSILSSLPMGVTYYYRLRCQRTNGLGTLTSCYSNVIAVDLDNPGISYSAPDSLCAGDTITLQLNAPGATVGWVGPNGFVSASGTSYITNASSLNSGNYIYTVNYPGCPVITDTLHIEIVDLANLLITPAGPYCSTGSVDTLLVNNGSVVWLGSGIVNPGLGTFNPSLAGAGLHNITCISNGYCPDTAFTSIQVNLNGGYTMSGSDTVCEGDNIVLNATSGLGATFNWWGPNGYSSANANNVLPQVSMLQQGWYFFSVTYLSCPTSIDSLEVTVLTYSNPTIGQAGPFCNDSPPQILTASPPGGSWQGNGIIDPVAGMFSPGGAGNGVHQIIYNMPGFCPDADTVNLVVLNSVSLASVSFPNVFTPNQDGENDLYKPLVPVGGHYQLTIYDRWGVLMYQGELDAGWDGKLGTALGSDGVYYWICEISSDCSPQPLIEKGFLQLFKP